MYLCINILELAFRLRTICYNWTTFYASCPCIPPHTISRQPTFLGLDVIKTKLPIQRAPIRSRFNPSRQEKLIRQVASPLHYHAGYTSPTVIRVRKSYMSVCDQVSISQGSKLRLNYSRTRGPGLAFLRAWFIAPIISSACRRVSPSNHFGGCSSDDGGAPPLTKNFQLLAPTILPVTESMRPTLRRGPFAFLGHAFRPSEVCRLRTCSP